MDNGQATTTTAPKQRSKGNAAPPPDFAIVAPDRPRSVYARVIAVMRNLGAIGKDHRNAEQKFAYRAFDDIQDGLNVQLSEQGLFYFLEVVEHWREQRTMRSGAVLQSSVIKARVTFFGEEGDSFSAIYVGEGMDSGDKSLAKAITAATKQCLQHVFAIATRDPKDGDAESPTHPDNAANSAPAPQVAAKAAPAQGELDEWKGRVESLVMLMESTPDEVMLVQVAAQSKPWPKEHRDKIVAAFKRIAQKWAPKGAAV